MYTLKRKDKFTKKFVANTYTVLFHDSVTDMHCYMSYICNLIKFN